MSHEFEQTQPLHLAVMAAGKERVLFAEDVAAQLFPKSQNPPTEEMIAGCRQCLRDFVGGIEAGLLNRVGIGAAHGEEGRTFATLLQNGLINNKNCTNTAIRQVTLWQLLREPSADTSSHRRTLVSNHRFLSQLVVDEDPIIAATALAVETGQARYGQGARGHIQELQATTLHWLCQEVASALKDHSDNDPNEIDAAAFDWLASQSEGENLLQLGLKLAYLLAQRSDGSERSALLRPNEAGLILFIGSLAAQVDVDPVVVLDSLTDFTASCFSLLLRAARISQIEAGQIFGFLAQCRFESRDVIQVLDAYESFSIDQAQALVRDISVGGFAS